MYALVRILAYYLVSWQYMDNIFVTAFDKNVTEYLNILSVKERIFVTKINIFFH